MKTYIYKGIPEGMKQGRPALLEPGDYDFIVASHDDPYEKNNKLIFPVKLLIEPSDTTIITRPWTGETRDGDQRDGIGEFLVAINRAPKVGSMPDWDSVDGARGRCFIKVREADDQWPAKNEIGRFYAPKQLGIPPKSKPVKEDKDDLNMDPSDIPF